mgnify:CR=1 FL=1
MSYLVTVEPHPAKSSLSVSDEQKAGLESYLQTELLEASASRAAQEALWVDCLRLYEAIPEKPFRDTPIEGFRNLEVPLIAISTDAIYAQITDLIFSTSPIITTQSSQAEFTEQAKSVQRISNWGVANPFNFRPAVNHTVLDSCLLGTGFYYIPFVERVYKTKSAVVKSSAPRIFSFPVEDFFVPGGSSEDLQFLSWVSARFWLSEGELAVRAKKVGGILKGLSP